jgi:hypothetical protein
MRIYLRHSVSTDRKFTRGSAVARLSAFIDAHHFPPFGLDRAPISALINHAPISPAEAPAHSLPSLQPPLSARLHFFASVCLIDAHLFPPFALDRPPISNSIEEMRHPEGAPDRVSENGKRI